MFLKKAASRMDISWHGGDDDDSDLDQSGHTTDDMVVAEITRGMSFAAGKEPTASHSIQHIIFMTLDDPHYSKLASYWSIVMTFVILASCVTYMVGTISTYSPSNCAHPVCRPGPGSPCQHTVCAPKPLPVLDMLEGATILIFTLDYILRILTVHAVPQKLIYQEKYLTGALEPGEPGGCTKTIRYALQPLNIVDVLAIVPYYIHEALHDDVELMFLRLLRLARVARVLKLSRYSEGMTLMINTLRESIPALSLLAFFMIVLTVVFGTLIYFCEEGTYMVTDEHPDGAYMRKSTLGQWELSPFASIFVASYWVVITATTVGFGDVYPSTVAGRSIAVLVAYSGIITIALPVTIVGRHFNEEFSKLYHLRKAEAVLMARHRKAQKLNHPSTTPTPKPHFPSARQPEELMKVVIAKQGKDAAMEEPFPSTGTATTTVEAKLEGGGVSDDVDEAMSVASEVSEDPVVSLRKKAIATVIREHLEKLESSTKMIAQQLDMYEALGMRTMKRRASVKSFK